VTPKFPPHIMRALRGRLDLAENDTSADAEINEYTAARAFGQLCAWKLGSETWASTVISWLEDCGYEVKEKP